MARALPSVDRLMWGMDRVWKTKYPVGSDMHRWCASLSLEAELCEAMLDVSASSAHLKFLEGISPKNFSGVRAELVGAVERYLKQAQASVAGVRSFLAESQGTVQGLREELPSRMEAAWDVIRPHDLGNGGGRPVPYAVLAVALAAETDLVIETVRQKLPTLNAPFAGFLDWVELVLPPTKPQGFGSFVEYGQLLTVRDLTQECTQMLAVDARKFQKTIDDLQESADEMRLYAYAFQQEHDTRALSSWISANSPGLRYALAGSRTSATRSGGSGEVAALGGL